MVRLRFLGFAHTAAYEGPSGRWQAGEVREVPEEQAAYLLRDFGQWFRAEPAAEPATSSSGSAAFPTDGPPRSSIVQASPRRRGTPRK